MGLAVCPAAIVAAPVEVVGVNLIHWERFAEWADVRLERCEPEGPATPGQTIKFSGNLVGLTFHFSFKVEAGRSRKSPTRPALFQPKCWRNQPHQPGGKRKSEPYWTRQAVASIGEHAMCAFSCRANGKKQSRPS